MMLKIREVHCRRWFLRKRINAITLYPFIFYQKDTARYRSDFENLRRHEWAHVDQFRKDGALVVYWRHFINGKRAKRYEEQARTQSFQVREEFK